MIQSDRKRRWLQKDFSSDSGILQVACKLQAAED